MKTLKSPVCIILCFALILPLTGCGQTEPQSTEVAGACGTDSGGSRDHAGLCP